MPAGAVGHTGCVSATHFAQSSGYSPTGAARDRLGRLDHRRVDEPAGRIVLRARGSGQRGDERQGE